MEKISVVVSCYNEEKALPLFYEEMERVRKQDFENIDFEYIFVDDGSKDKTLEEIKQLAKKDSNRRFSLSSYSSCPYTVISFIFYGIIHFSK